MAKAGKYMKTAGKDLQDIGKGMTLGLTLPIVGIGAAAIKSASDLSETESKFQSVFGNMSNTVSDFAKGFAIDFGRSTQEVKENLSAIQVVGKNYGLAEKDAANLSKQMLTLANDVAAFNNVDLSDATQRMTAAIRGEGEAAEALGFSINQTTLEEYARQKGITKSIAKMSQAELVQLRYGLLTKQAGDMVGYAQKEQGSFTAQLARMKGVTTDLAATLGQSLLPAISNIVTKINEFVESNFEWITSNSELIIKLALVAATLGPVLLLIGKLVSTISAVLLWGSGVNKAFLAVQAGTKGVGAIFTAVFGPAGIVLLVMAAVAGIVYAGYQIYKNWDDIKAKGQELKNAIAEKFSNIKDSIINVWDNIKTSTLAIWENLKNSINNVLNEIKSFLEPTLNFFKVIFENTWNVIKSIVLGAVLIILDIVTGNFTKLKSDIEGIWNNIKASLANIWSAIKTVAETAWNNLKTTVLNLCNSIKTTVISIWNSILTFFSQLPTKLYNYGSQMFTSMKQGISNTISGVKTAITSGINSAVQVIKDLPSQTLTWGKDFVQGFIDGITGKLSALKQKIEDMANSIREKLHFSRPDNGPLRDYETWMPDFMQGLANGIKTNKSLVTTEINSLASGMNLSNELDISGGNTQTLPQNLNIKLTMPNGKVLAEVVAPFMDVMQGKNVVLAGRSVGI